MSNKEFAADIETIFGFPANLIDKSKLKLHKVPARIKDEIPTLNQFGYMKEEFDEYSKEFAETSGKLSAPVVEIGTAYGWVTQHALRKDAIVIANDLSEEHLSILLQNTPEELLENLFLFPGKFPEGLNFPTGSIGAVLASRIFHFLDGTVIEQSLSKIYDWLISGGKFYFTACSIYHYSVKEKMLDLYRKNVTDGDKWPGRILNQKEVAPAHAPYIHDFFHVFDIPQLEKLLPEHGFKIDRISLFDYPNDTDSDNKGHVGFVATKI